LLHLAHFRRPRRAGEWTEAKAVTFIVTLAASHSVTLAAARSGMSRKAAYALRSRDAAFGAAWNEALRATARQAAQGDKVSEVYDSPFRTPQGDDFLLRTDRSFDAAMRDLFFAQLANRFDASRSTALARARPLP